MFTLLDDDEFEQLIDRELYGISFPNDSDIPVIEVNICCSNMMVKRNKYFSCKSCGRVKQRVNDSIHFNTIEGNYNSWNDSSALRIRGTDSYKYDKALLISTSNRNNQRKYENNKQFHNVNSRSDQKKLPTIIITRSNELFQELQKKGIVTRSFKRKGLMAACVYYSCIQNNIVKQPQYIADMFEIKTKQLFRGCDIVKKIMNDQTVCESDQLSKFEMNIFATFDIDERYRGFISDIDNKLRDSPVAGDNSSRDSTRCSGIFYILCKQLGLKIPTKDIEKYCNISASSIMRYVKYVKMNKRFLKKIFKEYGVPRLKRDKKSKRSS